MNDLNSNLLLPLPRLNPQHIKPVYDEATGELTTGVASDGEPYMIDIRSEYKLHGPDDQQAYVQIMMSSGRIYHFTLVERYSLVTGKPDRWQRRELLKGIG